MTLYTSVELARGQGTCSCSHTVTACPRARNSRAAAKPKIPAPMIVMHMERSGVRACSSTPHVEISNVLIKLLFGRAGARNFCGQPETAFSCSERCLGGDEKARVSPPARSNRINPPARMYQWSNCQRPISIGLVGLMKMCILFGVSDTFLVSSNLNLHCL